MAVFGMFNIVMLAIGLLELGLIAACVIAFITGCFRRNNVIIFVSLIVPVVIFGSLTVVSYIEKANAPFPPQLKAPNEQLLAGTYVLDSSSFDYLKSRGFQDLSATLVLNSNGTFHVTQMPHLWTDGSPESRGYDQCSGKWSASRYPNYDQGYYVVLEGEKDVFPMGALFLYISPPTGTRSDYALSVPIFYGDFDYIYFVRQPSG